MSFTVKSVRSLVLAMIAVGLWGAQLGNPALWLLPVTFLILGALVAADVRLPSNWVAALAIALGLVHGALNGAALRQGAGGLGLLGIMAALLVLVTLASAFVVPLKRPWTRIAVRVTGSWVAAIGLLLLGWAFRG